MRPALAPSRRRHGDVDIGERADVNQIDVAAVAGDVGAARCSMLARRWPTCCSGHQGECIRAAHYQAGRAPGAAAGDGRQQVRRALRSWPGWRMRLALAPSRRCRSWGACGRRPGRCCDRGWRRCSRPSARCAPGAGRRGAGLPPGRVHRRSALPGWARLPGAAAGGGRQQVRRVLRSWPGWRMRPALAPSRRRHGDVDIGERADVNQIDVAAVAGDVGAARCSMLARRWPTCCSGHQGECIRAAHYQAGRAPGAAAGDGRQQVRRALRSWPGWRMRLALAPSRRCRSWGACGRRPGRCCDRGWRRCSRPSARCAPGAGRRGAGLPPGRVHRRSALPGWARLPGAAAGGGRQQVRRVLRSWPGPCMSPAMGRRSAGTAMWIL